MSKKAIIITLIVMNVIFITVITIIIINKNKEPQTEEPIEDTSMYAVNEVKDDKRDSDNINDFNDPVLTNEVEIDSVTNVTYNHLELLTPSQKTNKSDFMNKVTSTAYTVSEDHGKLVSAEILDSSNKYYVYVNTTYEDGESIVLVAIYDNDYKHHFTRCISQEYFEMVNSGENSG